MPDPRHQKLSQVLIHYSLAIKPGDKLSISGHAIAAPLIREVYREAIRAGAHVTTYIDIEGLREIYYREASDEQLNYISELDKLEAEHFNAELGIWSEMNTKALSNVDPRRMAERRSARASLLKRSLERMAAGEVRWCEN